MAAHRIRLTGFWTITALADGRVRSVRRFGRPGGLSAGEAVAITGDWPAGAGVFVNGVSIGEAATAGHAAFAVTQALDARNELMVEATTAVGEAFVTIGADDHEV